MNEKKFLEINAWMMDDSGRVPVFVFPSEAEFVLRSTEPHPNRKCFTIYNPYHYPIAYKVLCTAPHNYTVVDPDGTLREKCYKDITIRCKSQLPLGTVDKLRFELRRLNDTEPLGHKDIPLRTVEQATSSKEHQTNQFYGMNQQKGMDQSRSSPPNVQIDQQRHDQNSAQWMALVFGVLCAAALMSPTMGDVHSSTSMVPTWLHLTLPQKLVAAYILGIVTILVVRPTP